MGISEIQPDESATGTDGPTNEQVSRILTILEGDKETLRVLIKGFKRCDQRARLLRAAMQEMLELDKSNFATTQEIRKTIARQRGQISGLYVMIALVSIAVLILHLSVA